MVHGAYSMPRTPARRRGARMSAGVSGRRSAAAARRARRLQHELVPALAEDDGPPRDRGALPAGADHEVLLEADHDPAALEPHLRERDRVRLAEVAGDARVDRAELVDRAAGDLVHAHAAAGLHR